VVESDGLPANEMVQTQRLIRKSKVIEYCACEEKTKRKRFSKY
jgi:hypothetical protein